MAAYETPGRSIDAQRRDRAVHPRRRVPLRTALLTATVALAVAASGTVAEAHADADLVAVAAGDDAVVTLRPNHGCGDSPTIEVRIRAPFADAIPGDVDGWTATVEPLDDGYSVLTWTGGELPTDQIGAFPVEFVVPDAAGRVITFPAIQTCANGEELAWIGGDPLGQYPVPRLLILAEGAEPVDTIDDLAADVAGRELLEANLDGDLADPDVVYAPQPPLSTLPASTVPATTELA